METATRGRRGGWVDETAARQVTELANAFEALCAHVPGLSVEVVGHVTGEAEYVHPVAGFHVRLSRQEGEGIDLYVSSRYGELVRWREGAGAAREQFDVRISEPGFGWGDSEYPAAAELAHDLLGYMQFNLDLLPGS